MSKASGSFGTQGGIGHATVPSGAAKTQPKIQSISGGRVDAHAISGKAKAVSPK